MGINSCILNWFDILARNGVFAGKSSVLELGPQDLFFPPEVLHEVAMRHLDAELADQSIRLIFDGAVAYRDRRSAFYSIFDLPEYMSADEYDERADYRLDLNIAHSAPEKFDVVIDCGTTEHVFNAANVFVFTHNTLDVGGVSLKVLPTFGDNTHGFYNIHPTVYFDIARVNGYEILDFRYIDNMSARPHDDPVHSLMSAAELESGLKSFAGCAAIQQKVSTNFSESLTGAIEQHRISQAHNTVDYCFVAMKKCRDVTFRYPGQGVYLTEF